MQNKKVVLKSIEFYIPQKAPFVMVSELVFANDKEAQTRFYIEDNNVLCENGKLDESGLIENIAQTAAAMTGFNAIKNGAEVKKGFIGSVDKLIITKLPQTQEFIDTKVVILNTVMNVHIIKGTITQKDLPIAECEMKIFLEE